MIITIINSIKTELETELKGSIQDLKIVCEPVLEIKPDATKPDKSQIAIYPGKLTINPKFKDTIPQQLNKHNIPQKIENNQSIDIPKQLEIRQEFKQELLVNIFNQDLEKIEEITSLVTAIILSNSNKFCYGEENQNIKAITTEYQSKTVSNTHTISQISLIEGTYIQQQNPFVFQLKFEVIGQIQMVKTVAEKVEIIKEYELEISKK
ncbi:MAG: hypothetical protein F6K17_25375 [Okeania sp. SIO3C4]|nr:hypothetical protein [Okeania sp. SIO3C4]